MRLGYEQKALGCAEKCKKTSSPLQSSFEQRLRVWNIQAMKEPVVARGILQNALPPRPLRSRSLPSRFYNSRCVLYRNSLVQSCGLRKDSQLPLLKVSIVHLPARRLEEHRPVCHLHHYTRTA